VRFHDGAGYSESEAQALSMTFLAVANLVKRMKDIFFLGIVNTGTRIRNSNQRKTFGLNSLPHSRARGLRHPRRLRQRAHLDADRTVFV